ncbi:MAG: helix-turn-helix domain-containing protein [Tannerella sp.]|jgi:ligand-binding sensor domain-containing protein/signal transduction histidine kinase/AraC-like DNA-binding protein/CheY-like chemotaxis protein|nr:helix-turn-helix domain-containing protein [Tannerella sp.]
MKPESTNRHELFCVIALWISFTVNAQQTRFYDVSNGLSSSYITSITQDKEGHIWIATEDGLNRFDGSRFVVYRNRFDDTTSLINNHIRTVYEDSKGRFWVATLTGLCLYDRTTDRFTPYKVLHFDGKREISQFYFLMEDRNGFIWACISGSGVVRIDADKNEYLYFNTLNSGICSDHINVIYEDRFGNIWFGSGQEGLSIYNPSNRTFRTFRYYPGDKNSISSNEISSICEDADGNVWVGTLTGGINIFSFAGQSFRTMDYRVYKISHLHRDSQNQIWIGTMGGGFDVFSTVEGKIRDLKIQSPTVDLSDTKVQTLFEDKQGNIWIGLFQKGVLMAPKEKNFFTNYHFDPYAGKPTIGEGAVQPVYMDSFHELWLGVDGKGVYRLDKEMNVIAHYGAGHESRLFDHVALTVCEDSKRHLWFGTFLNGAVRYNRSTDRFDLQLTKGDPPYGLLRSHITDIREDPDGKLWFATNGGGVNIYHPDDRTFEYLVHDESKITENQLIDNFCNMICFGHDSLVWISTFRGLCSYDRKKKSFTSYTSKNKQLPNDIVSFLKEDSRGNLWAGTHNGLACIDRSREHIKIYDVKDGLPNGRIGGIEEDDDGNLWITTTNGLSVYHPESEKFTTYTTADGLYTNEFMRKAIFKTGEGLFIVGSMKGITTFNPSEKRSAPTEPINLLFTNLYIFNEQVTIGSPREVLKKTVNYSDQVTFTHRQNSFSVEFSAIEYHSPDKVHYEVMMEGFNRQWQTVKNRMVTYTNLGAGDYTLHVRAWINDREHACHRQLSIRTLPPFWATKWAELLYLILFISAGYLAYRYINDRVLIRRQEQLTQAKLQFFTDISHEIRTPLTLILSPLGKLIHKNTDATLMQTYDAMYKNGMRLLQLVNQILDLRSVEFGKKKLQVEETNITVFVRDLKNSFNDLAAEKDLAYTFLSEPGEITGYIDTDIVSKALFNLISNAFKYTKQGSVDVSLAVREPERLVISIKDTGKGIPPDQQTRIFDRFYMLEPYSFGYAHSSGIGLNLTGKLIQLHHGEIHLESEEGKGSLFIINIPFRRAFYRPEEISVTHKTVASLEMQPVLLADRHFAKKKPKPNLHSRYTVLVVDDDDDIRRLIISECGETYRVLEAVNGREGLRLAIENGPDLIISDMMMPEMSGIEFCEKIRHNEKCAHIPFIMLTAYFSVEHQIKGLQHGADTYIAKPFDINFLQVTMARLIDSREKLKGKYSPAIPAEENRSVAQSPNSDKLMEKLNKVLQSRLSHPDLCVEVLCRELGMSRTHLNRKIKEMTGESPISYIRRLRLQKSALLLKERKLTVSEIAYAVGFSSPSYFCQAFRDYYGVTPKEYVGINKTAEP